MPFQHRGFTFIELLTALSIFLILAIMSVGVFFSFRPQNVLESDARRVESVLRLARTRTLSSLNSSNFGVHMEATQAVLFEGSTYDSGDPDNKVFTLAAANEVYDISLAGGGDDVVFDKLTGTTQ